MTDCAPSRDVRWWRRGRLFVPALAAAALLVTTGVAFAGGSSYIGGLTPSTVGTTVPANGDQNPYGMATVPKTLGRLVAGDILISNFNNAATTTAAGGLQGTGTTIDEAVDRNVGCCCADPTNIDVHSAAQTASAPAIPRAGRS